MNKEFLKIFKRIPTLTTERLQLRKIELRDIKHIYEYAKDPAVSEYLLWSPHPDIDFTREYVKYVRYLYRHARFYDWAIMYKRKMIGTVGFTSFDLEKNSAEIGYVLNRNVWGKGIATEAVNKIVRFGFQVLGLNRIEARFMPGNLRSKAVLIKCKFSYEGLKRDAIEVEGRKIDVELFSMTRDEFEFSNCNIP